jgi:hypothetical protein
MVSPKNKRVALIVANHLFSRGSGLTQLKAPPQDAEGLIRVLQNPKIGNFKVKSLINRTSQEVREAIEITFAKHSREDVLLFYYSGHGIKDEDGHLYFAMANTKRDMLQSTAIRSEEVNRMMQRSRSGQQVIILDCCNSGAFTKGLQVKSDQYVNTPQYFDARGRVILTACDAIQYAFEGNRVNKQRTVRSIFTETLIRGLERGEADLNRDGKVDIQELYDYLFSRIEDQTDNQTPTITVFDVKGTIIIAHNPAPKAPEPKLPEPKPRLPEPKIKRKRKPKPKPEHLKQEMPTPGPQPVGSTPSKEISIGDVVDGRYTVTKLLVRKPVECTYLVHDQRLNRKMTLKTIWGLSRDRITTELFEREWQILAGLNHPNIVHVYDRGVENRTQGER